MAVVKASSKHKALTDFQSQPRWASADSNTSTDAARLKPFGFELGKRCPGPNVDPDQHTNAGSYAGNTVTLTKVTLDECVQFVCGIMSTDCRVANGREGWRATNFVEFSMGSIP